MRDQKRHPTIEDVARTAGVSRAAVSKVLRNAYGVSPAMKERVGAAIEHLDYRPRVAARAMRGASFTLGIEVPDFGNQFFTRVLAGATRALGTSPYQLIIAPADGIVAPEGYRAIHALADRQVDGIVAISPLVPPEWLERLAERTPLVMLGRHDQSTGYDTVVGDDAAGARLVLDHLLGLGHRRIAHLTRSDEVTAPGSGTPHSIRLAVYRERMRAAGLEDAVRVVRTGEGEEAAEIAATELLRDGPTPTAIFAAHDELAIGALRAVGEAGADVSVAGYDDIRIAAQPGISLTTVNQSGEEMGERAIRLLLERIEGRTEAVHEVFAPTLVPRRSTRPPVPADDAAPAG